MNVECRVESVDYRGWKAQQISNRWVQLIVVPQNGGRLMQVTFNGHAYLFVNPKLAGKYMPPSQDQWFNYGGDKLWLLPEGTMTNNIGGGTPTCWMMDRSPFEISRMGRGVGSNSPDRSMPGPGSSSRARFVWTPTRRI